MTRLWTIIDGPKNRPFQALPSTAVNLSPPKKPVTSSLALQALEEMEQEDLCANNVENWSVLAAASQVDSYARDASRVNASIK